MSSTLREIADALADGLDAKTFTSVATQPAVERVNWPDYTIEEMVDPVIAVMPGTLTIERVDRTHHQYDYQATVFVGRHTPSDEMADDMLDLSEEIADAIRAHSWDQAVVWPSGVTTPVEVAIEVNPDDALHDRNVWRAVITATYRTFR
jgi:hypothetical protein